jgi:hypothetical protein
VSISAWPPDHRVHLWQPLTTSGSPASSRWKRPLLRALTGTPWLSSCGPQTPHERPHVAEQRLVRYIVVSLPLLLVFARGALAG